MVDRTIAPATRPFGHLHLPEPETLFLENGLKLMHYSGGDQEICRLTIKIPISKEYIGKATPPILAVLLAEGTATYAPEEFAQILDLNGASVNTHASEYFVTLTLNLLTSSLPAVMPLVVSALSEPLFDAERLENARIAAVNNLLTSRRNPAIIASDALKPYVYGIHHPLATLLQPDDIMAVKRENLVELFDAILNPSSIHAFLSGRFNTADVDTVALHLGKIASKGKGLWIPDLKLATETSARRIVTPFPESLQSAVAMAIAAPQRSHPDFIPLRLAVMALGGWFGSRLMSNIREEKGLTYGIDASLQGRHDGSFVAISAKCDKRFTAEVERETIAEICRLASEPPQGDELERLRLYATTSLAKTLDNPMSIMGFYSGRIEAGYPEDYFDRQQEVIESLTPDTISEMASRYLVPSRILTSIAGE